MTKANQKTGFEQFLDNSLNSLFGNFSGTWRKKSLGLLSLLMGFYLASSLSSYYLQKSGQRVVVVALLVLLIEIIIRLKSRFQMNRSLLWLSVDNLRIGTTYAIILEAFKLGS